MHDQGVRMDRLQNMRNAKLEPIQYLRRRRM